MNFIRFLELKEDSKKKSIPHNIAHLKLPHPNFICDMYRGFESIDNTLSIFTYSDLEEKERVIVNYELTKMDFKNVSNSVRYLEFDDIDLKKLDIKYKKTNINKYYDNIALANHYDMIELTSEKLINFILYFNKSMYENIIKRTELKLLIEKSLKHPFIEIDSISPYLLLEYKNRIV